MLQETGHAWDLCKAVSCNRSPKVSSTQDIQRRDFCTREASPGTAALPRHLSTIESNVQSIVGEGLLGQLTDPYRQSAYDMRDGIMSAEQAQLLMLFLFIRILNPTFFFFLIKINPQ